MNGPFFAIKAFFFSPLCFEKTFSSSAQMAVLYRGVLPTAELS